MQYDTPGYIPLLCYFFQAGADAVDVAVDAMAGTTSQPSMGALASSLARSPLDTGLDMDEITVVNDYWEECRGLYAPFESGQKSGSADVYNHEMPGVCQGGLGGGGVRQGGEGDRMGGWGGQ